jgi:hypothetical protein
VVFAAGCCVAADEIDQNPLPVFPGAEGFGSHTPGGRGGSVYEVTTLADGGPGSLRDALSEAGRIVVFRVAGTIELDEPLAVREPKRYARSQRGQHHH